MNTIASVAQTPPPAQAAEEPIEVRLTAIRYAARDTNIYEFTPSDGKPFPPYEPGAHIDLHLPNGIVRQYSLIEPEPVRFTAPPAVVLIEPVIEIPPVLLMVTEPPPDSLMPVIVTLLVLSTGNASPLPT